MYSIITQLTSTTASNKIEVEILQGTIPSGLIHFALRFGATLLVLLQLGRQLRKLEMVGSASHLELDAALCRDRYIY